MYLEDFYSDLEARWKGSLFNVKDAERADRRAKEYLYRLRKAERVNRVCQGWYYLPARPKDVWDFLSADKGFKVIIRQTASSIWNYDFIHRNVYHLAVRNASYKRAMESLARTMGWIFEVECYEDLGFLDYRKVGSLLVEGPESCIVSCVADWSFSDALAVLYFRREDISLERVKQFGRWKRISRTGVRAWNAIKYACNLFNERIGERIFEVKRTMVTDDVRELVEEAVDKVVEFA